jgi:uncharacterized membrane protein
MNITWNRRYAIWSYLRSSLWFVPLIALVVERVAFVVLDVIDERMSWFPAWPYGLQGTQTALQTIITLTLSFIVFTFGSMLVAIQVASGQLTPRIIATALLRDNVIRFSVGIFTFTLLFAIGTVAKIETSVPHVLTWIAALLGIGSMMAFLFLIDYVARLLRPVSIMWRVGEWGLWAIESVYPLPIEGDEAKAPQHELPRAAGQVIAHRGTSAVVLAVNLDALVAEATRINGVIRFMPRVGDFVADGDPLFVLYGTDQATDETKLRGSVAFGPERTIEQDSIFAFRIIVDIAIKALSKAINDPTTAVIAIDQLHRLLRAVGKRHLHDEQICDASGKLRVFLHTPNWEDFVEVACREIRFCGAENLQIARRLRAMIVSLIDVLPEIRRPVLRLELDLLDRTTERLYPFPEDLSLARIPDPQGLGGSSGGESVVRPEPNGLNRLPARK